jgi:N-methylhydantoinase A
LAFGGGGGLHAVALARELGCRSVIVPRHAAVFSALGMMMSDLRRDAFVTRLIADDAETPERLSGLIAQTAAAARAQFAAEGVPPGRLTVAARVKCRYRNQEHSVEVPIGLGPHDAWAVADLYQRFHALYQREYTYRLAAPVEIVGLHLIATAEVGKIRLQPLPVSGAGLDATLKGRRLVDYAEEGLCEATIYDATRFEPGMSFIGPAVIEDPGTTVVVHPGDRVTIDPFGNIRIAIERGSRP